MSLKTFTFVNASMRGWWLQDRVDALRQSNEMHESLFLPNKGFGRLSLEHVDSLRGRGNLRRETLDEWVY